MGDSCAGCASLRAEVRALKRDNARLARQLRRAVLVLARIKATCERLQSRAGAVLSRSSGVPRGTWSLARGVERAAAAVLEVLQDEG